METRDEDPCPRCGASALRAWYELSDDEREVVKRLPSSADFPLEDRAARHRWCPRCWHEARVAAPRDA